MEERSAHAGAAPALEGARASVAENVYKPGDTCGPYRIERFLDAGGFSEVYAARHRHTGRDVAVKVLLTHRGKLKEVAERFQHEVELLAALTHVNVVALHDAGTDGDRLWAAMELLEGRSLRLYLHERGALDVEEGLRLLFEIACGVAAAQELGVVHRDLKPENVFRTAGGVAKVLDFGIARFEGWGFQSTGRGRRSLLGTPSYMSPEQIAGETPTFATDVYQLGIIGYEMFAGRHPWAYQEGDFPTAAQLAELQVRHAPPPLTKLGVREEVWRLVEKALVKDPRDRCPSADAFAAATWRLLATIRRERAAKNRRVDQQNPEGPDGAPLGPLARRAYMPAETPPSDEPPPSGPKRKVELRLVKGGPEASPAKLAKTAALVQQTLPLDVEAPGGDPSAQQWREGRGTAAMPRPEALRDHAPVWLTAPKPRPGAAGAVETALRARAGGPPRWVIGALLGSAAVCTGLAIFALARPAREKAGEVGPIASASASGSGSAVAASVSATVAGSATVAPSAMVAASATVAPSASASAARKPPRKAAAPQAPASKGGAWGYE